MNERKNWPSIVISTLIIGSLLISPMRHTVYSQSAEEQIWAMAQQLDQSILQQADQAVFELLRKATAGEPISPSYYQSRRAKILAAIDEMERIGFCQAAIEAVPELAQKYDPSLPQELMDRLRAAGVPQVEIDQILQMPESEILQGAQTISQRGCEALLRQLIEQLDREIVYNMTKPRILRVSFTNVNPSCGTSILKAVGTWIAGVALCASAATLAGAIPCVGTVLAATGETIDAFEECSKS